MGTNIKKRRDKLPWGAVLIVLCAAGCQAAFRPQTWYTSERFPTLLPGYRHYYYFGTGAWWGVSVDYKGDVEGSLLGSYRLLSTKKIEVIATAWGDTLYGTGSVTRTGEIIIRSNAISLGLPFPGIETGRRISCPISRRVPLKLWQQKFSGFESVIWALDGEHPGVPNPWYMYLRIRHGEAKHLNLFKWVCAPKYTMPDLDSLPASTLQQSTIEPRNKPSGPP